MNMRKLPLVNGPVTFAGAVSLDVNEQGVHPWRIPLVHRDLFEPTLLLRAKDAAGVRLTFLSDTGSLHLQAIPEVQAENPSWSFDLLVDGHRHQRVTLPTSQGSVDYTGIPAGDHRLEIWLPMRSGVRVAELAIEPGASAKPWRDHRPKWTVYGSSISHCGSAAGPSETWPAIVANRLGLNLTCLGFGGNCQMEPMVGRMIRDLPADYISLCLGINVLGAASMSQRVFRAAVIGLIQTIRDGHPRTPIVVVSPLCNPPRETVLNQTGLSLVLMRQFVREAVEVLTRYGDSNLFYVDGLELFGPEYVHLMPDQLHPNAEGYRVLAERYLQVVMPRFGFAINQAAAS